MHPNEIKLACGATAEFCHEAGHGYRCHDCMAVVGSIAEPKQCREAREKAELTPINRGK